MFFNGNYYSLEECQLVCSLIAMGGDDDLASEIIAYERMSAEPVNCAGLHQYLMDWGFSATKGQIIYPLLWNPEAAKIRAQIAYTRWMEYMTGIIWQLVPSLCAHLRWSKAYSVIPGTRSVAGSKSYTILFRCLLCQSSKQRRPFSCLCTPEVTDDFKWVTVGTKKATVRKLVSMAELQDPNAANLSAEAFNSSISNSVYQH